MLYFDFEKAYLIFSIYPQILIENVCPCCIDQDTLDNLNALDLKSLNYWDVSVFLKDGMTTSGSKSNLARLLPRVLELASQNGFASRITLLCCLKVALYQG